MFLGFWLGPNRAMLRNHEPRSRGLSSTKLGGNELLRVKAQPVDDRPCCAFLSGRALRHGGNRTFPTFKATR